MNAKNLRLIAGIIIGLNLTQTSTQATVLNSSTTFPTVLTPTVFMATSMYVGYNFLTRQKFLVSEKFKEAQAWYDSIAAKYPQAGLNHIIFVQTPKSDPISEMLAGFAKKCSWTSSYNYIFFKKEDLKEINHLYKKVLEGSILDEKDAGKLAGYEFTLLHEAGHIKYNDAQTLLASVFALLGTSTIAATYLKEDMNATKDQTIFPGINFLGNKFFEFKIPGTLNIVSTGSFVAALTIILRLQEDRADAFAISTADLQALKGGLKAFENEETDALYGIENATVSPYIQNDSFIALFFQNLIGSVECAVGFAQQQVYLVMKSTKPTRWVFDFVMQDPIHAGPSVRAQAIKDEIEKRNTR